MKSVTTSSGGRAAFQRAVYSIKPQVLTRFNTLYRVGERSKLVERFLDEKVREKEQAFVDAARLIERDPALRAVRGVSRDVDALAGETFRNL